MKNFTALLILSAIATASYIQADEAAIIELFNKRGDRVTLNDSGHAIKLFSGGKPELTRKELSSIAELTHLEELAINAAPAGDDEWKFLKKLTNLKKLTIWHGHHFSTLEPFCDLPVESLLLGGCMGLRTLNKESPENQRNAVLSLHDLPNLKSLTLYHSPIAPDDSHLAHILAEFPNLTELRLDFIAPRGQEINITIKGIQTLAKLKLTKLTIENADDFDPIVFAELGNIKTLEKLHIQPKRRDDYDESVEKYEALLISVKKELPDLEVTIQEKK